MSTNSMKRVLHLAVEYPSRNRKHNTPAVRHFIQANPKVDYRVFALRRTANPFKCNLLEGDGYGDDKVTSMRYWGLPGGVLLFLSMTIVAWRIHKQIKQSGVNFHLIHAHKMAFEGLAGWWLSKWLNLPLALSVRGEAESKILRYKPHYTPLLQSMLARTDHLFYVSAWFKPVINGRFKVAKEKQSLLPNFVSRRHWCPKQSFNADHLVSVMDLNVYEKKGLPVLLAAIAQLANTRPELKLDIIGGGSEANVALVNKLITRLKIENQVSLLGKIDNQQLLNRFGDYAAMVLPSRNETFGMVYVEALLSGVPILHSSHTGIDGFLEGISARVIADPKQVDSVASALNQLLDKQHDFRMWLIDNHHKVAARFDRAPYIEHYNQCFNLTNDEAPAAESNACTSKVESAPSTPSKPESPMTAPR
ncbi:glycosyltransferase [Ferrimonas aestuarii]|uniref:Glycosyltransferase family 4 protein n=1 Tax=Ferrimonas aestuarii TaxID=2569539 RepID=A0A4U1BPB9_9GAMM|nr:glycosyltransferase [Ferrimonas aestuarii]TKB51968.1 glycosyltransferase family 4 protein [Ferrimonas aestuarii]